MLIELFSLGITAEALRANIGSKSAISLQRGPVDSKFQVEGVAPINHSSQKTRLNDLSYGIIIWTHFLFRFVIMHAFDRHTDRETDKQTDRRTEFSSLDRVRIPCSAAKKKKLPKRCQGVSLQSDIFVNENKYENRVVVVDASCANFLIRYCFATGNL